MKSAGASLLGSTVAGFASATDPENTGVSLLEVLLSFEFHDDENLHVVTTDRPAKYVIDPEEEVLKVLTVEERERQALVSSDSVVHFRNVSPNPNAIGNETINELFLRTSTGFRDVAHAFTPEGYDLPTFALRLDPSRDLEPQERVEPPSDVAIESRKRQDGFGDLRLPSRNITMQKRIVHDEPAENDDNMPLGPTSRVERKQEEVEVDPYLTVAYHPDLDVVEK